MENYNCVRCGGIISDEVSNPEYFGYCQSCDEDMYKFECIKQKETMAIKELARELVEGVEYDWGHCSTFNLDEWCTIMVEFAHQMCEIQKVVCAEYAFVTRRTTTWDLNPETKERYTDDELKALYKDSNKKLYCKGNGESDLYFVSPHSILNTPNVCKK
jgi:hypothetical protein